MARFTSGVQTLIRQRIMKRVGPVDLSQVHRVPDRLIWPLRRDGFDPVARLGAQRESAPVAKLTSFLGLDVWLVTGERGGPRGARQRHVVQQRHPPVRRRGR